MKINIIENKKFRVDYFCKASQAAFDVQPVRSLQF